MAPLVTVALLLAALPDAAATARFSNVFGSQMVLQRDQPIELWGFNAAPDASQLTVHWGSAAGAAYWPVSADGSWRALLPALPAAPCNGTALVLKSAGVAVDTLADVCIGDVYLFSGQSNIDIPQAYGHQFSPAAQAADEAFADANPDIRLMIVPNQVPGLNYQETPAKELAVVPDCPLCGPPFDSAGKYNYCQCNTLRWARANGTVVRGFSATAWFTGKALRKADAERVPLGLIRSSWGGTKIREWSSAAAIAECTQAVPAPPGTTTKLFANMILPLVGLNFKAVTWYQGESDVGPVGGWSNGVSFFGSAYYGCALSAMLRDWRVALRQPALPFLVVELAAYCNEHGASTFRTWCDQPTSFLNATDGNLPEMRLAQAKAVSGEPLNFLVSAADLGSVHPDQGSIHPARKPELGARLALAAQAAAVAPIVPWAPAPPAGDASWHGPRAVTAKAAPGGLVAVEFDAPLSLNASASCPASMLASPLGKLCCTGAGFEIGSSDGAFALAASAQMAPGKDDTVLLKPSAETLMRGAPTSVRYAHADWPVCSVRNTKMSGGSTTEALPARIFTLMLCGTDRCPGVMCANSHCPPTTGAAALPAAVPEAGAGVGAGAGIGPGAGVGDQLADTVAAVGSVLAARSTAPPPPPRPEENFIPAASPSCWYTGRTKVNADGSRSFDWSGTQAWVNIHGASYIKMVMKTSGGISGRFAIELNALEVGSLSVGATDAPQNRLPNNTAVVSQEYRVAADLQSGNAASGIKDNVTVRAILVLEPAFTGAAPGGGWEANAPGPSVPKTFTLLGWKTDGTPLPASQPRPRRIELIGDSISAGYGARGNPALHNKSLASNLDRALCPVNDQTSGIAGGGTANYIWRIAEHFGADLANIAWSGKGMYRNCCDPGEKMPAYWLQTLGGGNHTADWDHSRFVPDMMIVNLGTNDAPSGAAGICPNKNFSDAYTAFVLNAAKVYRNPKLPVFVAQGPMNCQEELRIALSDSILAINKAGGNAIFLDLCGPVCDGCGGHPGQLAHAAMADMAIPRIAKEMGW